TRPGTTSRSSRQSLCSPPTTPKRRSSPARSRTPSGLISTRWCSARPSPIASHDAKGVTRMSSSIVTERLDAQGVLQPGEAGWRPTTEDLLGIAAEAGLDVAALKSACGELHSLNASRSVMVTATAAHRFAMWAEGRLVLDTTPIPRVAPPRVIDVEAVTFLAGLAGALADR